MYDISAANLVSVSLYSSGGFGSSIEFSKEEFAADSSPVRLERAPVARNRIDLNKRLVPSRDYRPIRVTLAPIPNTSTDNKMKTFLHRARNVSANDENGGVVDRMTIVYRASAGKNAGDIGMERNVITLEDGFISSGDLGIDVMAEGRYGTPAYVFEFARIDGSFNSIMTEGGKKSTTKKKQPKVRINPKKTGGIFYFGQDASGRETRGFIYRG